MKKDQVIVKVKRALNVFLKDDIYLLQKNLSERTICAKLAFYLQEEFKEFHVDCEYNRHINTVKRLNAVKDYVREKREAGILTDEEENFGICTSPDIIVHHRGINENNLLIIEAKKKGNPLEDKKYDFLKIEGYIKELEYKYGLFIEFSVGDDAGISVAKVFDKNHFSG